MISVIVYFSKAYMLLNNLDDKKITYVRVVYVYNNI